MDWARAKTVMIFIFLVLNVVLWLTLQDEEYRIGRVAEQADWDMALEQMLQEKKIDVRTLLPSTPVDMPRYTVRVQTTEHVFPQDRFPDRSSLYHDATVQWMIEDMPINTTKEQWLRLEQRFKDIPVWGLPPILVQQDRNLYVRLRTIIPLKPSSDEELDRLSATVAVAQAVKNAIPSRSNIEAVRAGYCFIEKSMIIESCWQIEVENGLKVRVSMADAAVRVVDDAY